MIPGIAGTFQKIQRSELWICIQICTNQNYCCGNCPQSLRVCVCVQCSVFYFCSMVGCQMRESFHLKWLVPSCSSTHQFLLDVCNHQPTSTIIFKIYVLQISIVTSMIHSFNSWNSLFWLVEFRTNPFLIPFQSRQRDALFLWVAVH